MNANAAELEQQAGRAIMSSFHGFWSAGAMVAALSGGFVIARFGAEFLAASTGIAALAAAIGGFNWLEKKADTDPKSITKIAFLPRSLIPWLFGLIAFTGFVSEGAVIDWSAHYFRTELASSIEMSGFAFGGFSFSMMLARFIGDRLREKFTDRALFVYSILIAALGLACVIGAPNPILASLGFFLAGFSWLAVGLLLLQRSLQRRAGDAVEGSSISSLTGLSLANAARNPQRSQLTTALIACATFVIVAVGAADGQPIAHQIDG